MKRMVLAVGCVFVLFASTPVWAQQTAKSLVDRECFRCHSAARVYKANKNLAAWDKTLDRMTRKGAGIKPSDRDAVLKYLNTLNK